MILRIVAVIGLIFLAGCSTTAQVVPVQVREVPIFFEAPRNLYECPTVESFPDPDTLTNEEVAKLITTLDYNNKYCKANLGAIASYEARVKAAAKIFR